MEYWKYSPEVEQRMRRQFADALSVPIQIVGPMLVAESVQIAQEEQA